MKGFLRLVQAQWKEYLRNRMGFVFGLLLPFAFMALLGLVFGGRDGFETVDLGVVDLDHSTASQTLVERLGSAGIFAVSPGKRDEELSRLKNGTRDVVLVIPAGLQENFLAGRATDFEVYYNAADLRTAQVALAAVRDAVNAVNARLTQSPPLVAIVPREVAGRRIRYIDYLVPGVLAMTIMQLGIFFITLTLASWRERGLFRRLAATPVSKAVFVASQVTARLLFALLQVAILVAVALYLFRVTISGSLTALAFVVVLGVLTFIALGYLIASLAKTTESANSTAQLVNLPMMFLGGVFFPVDNAPAFLQPVVKAIPVSYLSHALRQVYLGGAGVRDVFTDAAVLGAWLVACTIGSVALFRWE